MNELHYGIILFLCGFGLGFIAALNVVFTYAQDFDPCFINNDMYQRVCDKQEIDRIMQDLLERAREWNDK